MLSIKKFIAVSLLVYQSLAVADTLRQAQLANARGDWSTELSITRHHAALGKSWAQGMLGNSYYTGKGVRKDEQEAIRLWKLSADGGQPAAQFNLGLLYDQDWVVFRDHRDILVYRDYEQAVIWYRKAAEGGHANARLNLGFMYYSGRGVQQDYAAAALLFISAAKSGVVLAQYNTGYIYEHAHGVEQNYREAIKWYKLAAAGGNTLASDRLAALSNTISTKQIR
jgi:TPR repeat protein